MTLLRCFLLALGHTLRTDTHYALIILRMYNIIHGYKLVFTLRHNARHGSEKRILNRTKVQIVRSVSKQKDWHAICIRVQLECHSPEEREE